MENETEGRLLRQKERKIYIDTGKIDDEIEGKRTFDVEEKLACRCYDATFVKEMKGSDVNIKYFQEHGFNTPLVVYNRTGLNMKIPDENFTVDDVKKNVGTKRTIDVMDVTTQQALTMTMKDWIKYYNSTERDRILNVLSLEFSHSRLQSLVQQPEVVKQIDWVDTAWPRHLKQRQTETTNVMDKMHYPKVQKYCLMSVGGCYTDFHIDMGGTSVWYHILRGSKTFWLIPPTDENLALYEKWTLSMKQGDEFFGDKVKECQRITLKPGWTFFIPTGWIHAVHTPIDSLVFGGNFLHSFGIPMQLKIWNMENTTHVPMKFRYPFFTEIHWYVLERYVNALTGVSHRGPEPVKKMIKTEKKEEENRIDDAYYSSSDSVENTRNSTEIDVCDDDIDNKHLSSEKGDNLFEKFQNLEMNARNNDKETLKNFDEDQEKEKVLSADISLGKDELEGIRLVVEFLESLNESKRYVPNDIINPDGLLFGAKMMLEKHGIFSSPKPSGVYALSSRNNKVRLKQKPGNKSQRHAVYKRKLLNNLNRKSTIPNGKTTTSVRCGKCDGCRQRPNGACINPRNVKHQRHVARKKKRTRTNKFAVQIRKGLKYFQRSDQKLKKELYPFLSKTNKRPALLPRNNQLPGQFLSRTDFNKSLHQANYSNQIWLGAKENVGPYQNQIPRYFNEFEAVEGLMQLINGKSPNGQVNHRQNQRTSVYGQHPININGFVNTYLHPQQHPRFYPHLFQIGPAYHPVPEIHQQLGFEHVKYIKPKIQDGDKRKLCSRPISCQCTPRDHDYSRKTIFATKLDDMVRCSVCEVRFKDELELGTSEEEYQLKECLNCYKLTHPECFKRKFPHVTSEGVLLDGLPHSWLCPRCVVTLQSVKRENGDPPDDWNGSVSSSDMETDSDDEVTFKRHDPNLCSKSGHRNFDSINGSSQHQSNNSYSLDGINSAVRKNVVVRSWPRRCEGVLVIRSRKRRRVNSGDSVKSTDSCSSKRSVEMLNMSQTEAKVIVEKMTITPDMQASLAKQRRRSNSFSLDNLDSPLNIRKEDIGHESLEEVDSNTPVVKSNAQRNTSFSSSKSDLTGQSLNQLTTSPCEINESIKIERYCEAQCTSPPYLESTVSNAFSDEYGTLTPKSEPRTDRHFLSAVSENKHVTSVSPSMFYKKPACSSKQNHQKYYNFVSPHCGIESDETESFSKTTLERRSIHSFLTPPTTPTRSPSIGNSSRRDQTVLTDTCDTKIGPMKNVLCLPDGTRFRPGVSHIQFYNAQPDAALFSQKEALRLADESTAFDSPSSDEDYVSPLKKLKVDKAAVPVCDSTAVPVCTYRDLFAAHSENYLSVMDQPTHRDLLHTKQDTIGKQSAAGENQQKRSSSTTPKKQSSTASASATLASTTASRNATGGGGGAGDGDDDDDGEDRDRKKEFKKYGDFSGASNNDDEKHDDAKEKENDKTELSSLKKKKSSGKIADLQPPRVLVQKYPIRPAPVLSPPEKLKLADGSYHKLDMKCWMSIFSWLSQGSLLTCSEVCRTWNRWALHHSLWKTISLPSTHLSQLHLVAIVKRQPRNIDLSWTNISYKKLDWLMGRLPHLRCLDLSGCSWAGLCALCSPSCPLLESLNLSWVSGLISGCVRDLVSPPVEHRPGVDHSLSRLRYCHTLHLCGANVNTTAIPVLAQNLPKLSTLRLDFCVKLCDESIETIAKFMPCMKVLSLSRCHGLTTGVFKHLKVMRGLETLEMHNCLKISNDAVKNFAQDMKANFDESTGIILLKPHGVSQLTL